LLNQLTINSEIVSKTCESWRLRWDARLMTEDASARTRTSGWECRIAFVNLAHLTRTSGCLGCMLHNGVVSSTMYTGFFFSLLIGTRKLFLCRLYFDYIYLISLTCMKAELHKLRSLLTKPKTSTPASSTPASSTTSGSATVAQGQGTSTASSGAQSTTDVDNVGSSGGLSNGGKIGLAVGMAVFGVVSIASVLVFCSNRGRKRKQKDAEKKLANIGGSDTTSDKALPEVYRGAPTPVAPNRRPNLTVVEDVLPVNSSDNPSRTPVSQLTGMRSPAFAELEGGQGPTQEYRPLNKPVHELQTRSERGGGSLYEVV
jgi:hypothetical protein